jgi:hypothetical protein
MKTPPNAGGGLKPPLFGAEIHSLVRRRPGAD